MFSSSERSSNILSNLFPALIGLTVPFPKEMPTVFRLTPLAEEKPPTEEKPPAEEKPPFADANPLIFYDKPESKVSLFTEENPFADENPFSLISVLIVNPVLDS